MAFFSQIVDILEKGVGDSIQDYREDRARREISFSYDSNTVSFRALVKLSKLLGTTEIFFEGDKERYRISEVTSDTSYSGDFRAYGVVFPEAEEKKS